LIVSDSSPLIYLAALDDFELLRMFFSEISIPQGVFEEVVIGGAQFPVAREVVAAQGRWIHVRSLEDASKPEEFRKAGLDAGESEALALALECRPDALLLDDSDAVHRAVKLGLNVIRTAGVYRLAKQRGLITAVAPKLDELRKVGFWLRDDHYRAVLKSVGEL
jgi:predicted nucleic acid-binding protein